MKRLIKGQVRDTDSMTQVCSQGAGRYYAYLYYDLSDQHFFLLTGYQIERPKPEELKAMGRTAALTFVEEMGRLTDEDIAKLTQVGLLDPYKFDDGPKALEEWPIYEPKTDR